MGLEADPCPHCGAMSRLDESAKMVWVCGACAGPRIPADVPGLARANVERGALIAARGAKAAALWSRAGAVLFLVTSLMALAVGGLLMLASVLAAAILGVFGAVFFALALYLFRVARRSDKTSVTKLDEAWEIVAHQVLRARGGGTTAAELAQAMRTTEAHAEQLLALVSLRDDAGAVVGEDAELRYAARVDAPPAQVRVADDAEVVQAELPADDARAKSARTTT